jgi:hypothetical protein
MVGGCPLGEAVGTLQHPQPGTGMGTRDEGSHPMGWETQSTRPLQAPAAGGWCAVRGVEARNSSSFPRGEAASQGL